MSTTEKKTQQRRGRRRLKDLQESAAMMLPIKKTKTTPVDEENSVRSLLDPLDAFTEPATHSEQKDEIIQNMTQKITQTLEQFLEEHGVCDKKVDISDLLEEERKFNEEFRDGMNANFFKLYRKPDEVKYLDQMISKSNETVPEVTKSYCKDFFRPRNPFNPLERDCSLGASGMCISARILPLMKNPFKNSSFCCREFLLPKQLEELRGTHKFSFKERLCILCNRFKTTWVAYESTFYQTPVAYIIQDHKVKIGGDDGYDLQNCITIPSSGLEFYGISWPFYKYNRSDYIFQSKDNSLEIPLAYLNQLREEFDFPKIDDVDKCNNVLRSIPHLNKCRCTIINGTAENSVEILSIDSFPSFTELLMKPEIVVQRELENF